MASEALDFDTYGGFLRSAAKRYWDQPGGSKVTFLALILATRHSWGVALEKGLSADSGKKVLTGAASIAAVTVLLRIVLGGPLGILLAGASVASLVAVYAKNHEDVWRKVGRIRQTVDAWEEQYDELANECASKGIDAQQRHLMMDGLVSRFLEELDKPLEPKKPDIKTAFAEHIDREKASEEQATKERGSK